MSKRPIKRAIRRQARKNGIRPSLLLAQLNQESGLRENVGSPAGARDIAQFIPSTAKTYGVTLGDNNPYDDIRGAAKMMGQLIHQYGGNERKALAAYNAGAGAVAKYGGVPPYAETQNYVKSIEAAAGKGSSSGSARGGGSQQQSNSRTVKIPGQTIQTSAGVDNSMARKQALLAYFTSGQRYQPGGLLNLSSTLQTLKDVPATSKTIKAQTVKTGFGGAQTGSNGAQKGTGKVNAHGDLQLPRSFGVTHQTAGLPGYPARDIFGKPGEAVGAPVSGKVIKLSGSPPSRGAYEGQGGPFGWSVYIQGDNGHTYYLTHFGSRNVKVGQRVKRGQTIGTVGNYPGSTADHIHEGRH